MLFGGNFAVLQAFHEFHLFMPVTDMILLILNTHSLNLIHLKHIFWKWVDMWCNSENLSSFYPSYGYILALDIKRLGGKCRMYQNKRRVSCNSCLLLISQMVKKKSSHKTATTSSINFLNLLWLCKCFRFLSCKIYRMWIGVYTQTIDVVWVL